MFSPCTFHKVHNATFTVSFLKGWGISLVFRRFFFFIINFRCSRRHKKSVIYKMSSRRSICSAPFQETWFSFRVTILNNIHHFLFHMLALYHCNMLWDILRLRKCQNIQALVYTHALFFWTHDIQNDSRVNGKEQHEFQQK